MDKFKGKLLIFAVILATVFLFYGPNLADYFVSDDFDWLHLTASSETKPLHTFVGNYYGEHGVGGTFRPMVNVSFAIMHAAFGFNPIGYHAVLLLLHAIAAYLVYCLTTRLFSGHSRRYLLGVLAALIFAVWPSHAEAVIWIAAIGDPLAAVFYLGAFLLYLNWRETGEKWRIWISLGIFSLGLLTKEIVLTLPVLILGYELILRREFNWRLLVRDLWPFFGLTLGYLIYRFWAIGLIFGYYASDSLGLDPMRWLISVIQFDIGSILFESARRSVTEFFITFWPVYLVAFLLSIGILIYWQIKSQNKKLIFLAYYWLLNAMLVLPLGMSRLTDEGERYGYLASVAVAIMLAWLVVLVLRTRFIAGVIFAVALLSYGGYALTLKSDDWTRASEISAGIVHSLDSFEYDDYKKSYFVGMPESYRSAQVMRNGITQALWLRLGEDIEAERIPVYLQMDEENFRDSFYQEFEYRPDGFLVRTWDRQFIISGNATEDHSEYKFELWGYDYERGLSDAIRLQFQGGREFDWAREELQLIYYTGGGLRQLRFTE